MNALHGRTLLCIGIALMTSACVTNATTELTEAPFVATSDLTNGTTNAVADLTGAISDFTSSTTPGAAGSQNPAWAKKRLQAFTRASYENLRFDISRGHGEYLVSLATLAGIPSLQFPQFQSLMQDSYSTMFDDVLPAQESTRQIVEIAWMAGYGRVQ